MEKPFITIWKKCCRSVCSIRFTNSNDIEIITLTGFKVGSYILTNDIVNGLHNFDFVEIKFYKEDSHSTVATERLSKHDFSERIITTYDAEITGFAVLTIEDLSFNSIPSLVLSKNINLKIGTPACTIGFQYDNPSLAIKSGIISTFIYRNRSRYIQFDGSMIWGNSGCPLIETGEGEVIGILGYRLDRKFKFYEKLSEISKGNIKMLEPALGKFEVEGVDPIQVLIAWERQIKQLWSEIYKSTSHGIGIATDSRVITKLLKSSGISL